MNMLEAVHRRRKEIEAAHIEASKEGATKRIEFKTALRERLDLQYDLQFTDEHFASWEVWFYPGNSRYDVAVPAGEGHICATDLRVHDITPPGADLKWSAFRYRNDEDPLITTNFVDAITFALTGERL